MTRLSLETRQTVMRYTATDRKRRRSELLEARRKAKAAKKVYRRNQRMYLSRKKAKVALIKGEREAYQASTRAFMALAEELRHTKDRLRGARLEYESALPSVIKLQLEYARGWREGQEQLRRSTNGRY